MPTDHPDGTRSIVISRADIQMPIDVQHQTVNVKTNFKEQEVGVYSQPEWATKEGIQKSDSIFGDEVAEEGSPYSDYVVTTGKTLYITQLSGMLVPSPPEGVPDLDPMAVGVTDTTASIEYFRVGGDGGCGMALPSPIKIPSGHNVRLHVYNCAPYTVSILVGWWVGYEI